MEAKIKGTRYVLAVQDLKKLFSWMVSQISFIKAGVG